MTASQAANDLFPVEGGGELTGIGDRLVEIRFDDPDHRLGTCPEVVMERLDPRRPEPCRSLPLDEVGKGRYFGWLPDDVRRVVVRADETGVADGRPPHIRLRAVPVWRMILLAVVHRPRRLRRVLALLVAGNRKGAKMRFVRLFDTIGAPSYALWARLREHEDARARPAEIAAVANWPTRPTVSILIGPGSASAVATTRTDLQAQTYPPVQVAEAHATVVGDIWGSVPAGTRLSPDALLHLVRPFAFDPEVVASYSDEDRIGLLGRARDPDFRPAFGRAQAETGALDPSLLLLRREVLEPDENSSARTAAARLLEVSRRPRARIAHVPRVLIHRRGRIARATPVRSVPRLDDAARPSVSVIIPSRDRADLLEACLDGLFRRTAGVDLDIVIVDNGSREARTAELYDRLTAEPRLRRVDRPGPFNFPALIAAGVEAARHELVLLLNNDVEAIESDWLRAMIAEMAEPDVGAVGARLLFPDGFVQHGGVTLGAGGIARHTFHFFARDDGEDRGWLARRRDVSAVTAACLLTSRTHWRSVGGMDADRLAVAYNDVDFCLKLRRAGLRVIWTPEATLVHRESVTRGPAEKNAKLADEEAVMMERWAGVLGRDPFHNPNLSLVAEPFVLDGRPGDRRARFP